MRRRLIRGLEATVVVILTLPLLASLHEILILFFASLLDRIAEIGLLTRGLRLVMKSPVHTQLLVETLGGIRPRGIAASGAFGALLQQILPGLFMGPEFAASGAWISAILDKTTTVLSLFLTRAFVEVVFIVLGALLLRAGLQRRTFRAWIKEAGVRDLVLGALGLFGEAQAIWTLFFLTLSSSAGRLDEMGLGFALSLLWRVDPERYAWLMGSFFPIAIPLALIGTGYAIAWLVGGVLDRMQRRRSRRFRSPAILRNESRISHRGVVLIAVLPLAGLVSQSQCYFGLARTNLISLPAVVRSSVPIAPTLVSDVIADSTPEADVVSKETVAAPSSPVPSPTLEPKPTPAPRPAIALIASSTPGVGPSPTPGFTPTVQPTLSTPSPSPTSPSDIRVRIRRTERGRLITVNGRPMVITGMNYNVNYTALPAETKQALHRRDFQIMKEAGVNAIIGWGIYDEATLEIAQEFGIGVIMPFELDPQGAFENQNYREEIKENWRAYVKRFRRFPAVWAWNPGGDELLHRMDTEQHRTVDKLQAAADFLVELSVLAHSLDPNRVSVIKEPRDWYVPHLHEAIKKSQARSPSDDVGAFLVYAVNIYGNPDEIVDALRMARQNAEERLGVALLVGEFAPFGLPRADRGIHYARIWDDVVAFSPNGGFAYVFGPDQPNPQAPNPYDPVRLLVNEFSLVDNDGKTVDDALSALAAKYHQVQNPSSAP